MPTTPPWDIPPLRAVANTAAARTVTELLQRHDLKHLHVLTRGRQVVVYSEEPDGEKVSRIRFTRIGTDQYELGAADHRGKWGSTSLTGSLKELFEAAVEHFGWLLAEF